MPVRAVNLKIVVPRQPGHLNSAQALWATHDVVNRATKFYEQMLLLCRQQDYLTRDQAYLAADQLPELDKLIVEARKRNGYSGSDGLVAARERLRTLYETIVPPAVGKTGNAQAVGAFVSPLLDPASRGFTEIFDKIKDPPNWVDGVRTEDKEAIDAARAWLETPRGQERLKATGAPAKWMRLAKSGDPAWPTAFVEDLDAKTEEAKGTPTLMQELRDLGVMPLLPSFFASRIDGKTGAVSTWDRLAMRLAVSHLLSWESWVNRARKEHEERQGRLDNFTTTRISGETAQSVNLLRAYEAQRLVELREEAELEAGVVRTTPRTIRGWRDLREKWLRNPDAPESELVAIIAEEQTRQRGRFGDPHLFRWLAKPAQKAIWNTAKDRDDLSLFATLRAMELLVERSRDTAFMTFPDAAQHPRSAQWEPAGGANLKNFDLHQSDDGLLSVSLPLLALIGDDRYQEASHSLALAKSNQLGDVRLDRRSKKYWFEFKTQTGEDAEAEVGSADLLMNWYHLRQRSDERRSAGDIGPVFLKLALDVQPIDPVGDPKKTPPAVHHFNTASGSTTRHADGIEEGFRVLSVDLGVRTLATCSVFELTRSQVSSSLFFRVADLPLRAVHERSFTLQLDGEEADQESLIWREAKAAELRRLRGWLARYRSVRALSEVATDERTTSLLETIERSKTDGWDVEAQVLEPLLATANSAEPVWQGELKSALERYRQAMAPIVSDWRRSNRARSADAKSGKSMWAIEYLTNTRRFLQSWSLLSESGIVRRLDNEKNGVFAKHILDHLEGLKEDRLKTGADLLVQAARGYRRDKNGRWEKAFAPCHAILFEDLTRYRMRTDRPRRENSQLMKWAHRAMPQEVQMQAELHGIHVIETGAAFSSRFHAATHTPGIRMKAISKRDLGDEFMLDIIERQNPGTNRSSLKVGQLVQMDGGEIFVCPTKDGIKQLHADVNAAQNLQRRFFTRHEDAFRIVARKVFVDGKEVWVPKTMGKRLVGALGGHGVLQLTGHDSGSCRFEPIQKRQWAKLAGESLGDDEKAGSEEDEELARLEEEALERTGEVIVYFRDPSGVALPSDLWYPQRTFWSIVKSQTLSRVRAET
jgi:hypothetical protein